MSEPKKKDVLQQVDAEAIRLARTLIRSARYGALATIEPTEKAPQATRVAVATDIDGTPIILISELAGHTPALRADPRCSLLLGEAGKGDPLAHARITIACRAQRLERGGADHERAAQRFLNRNPKAKLYADLGDFAYFRLEPTGASLNGGFGRAYRMEPAHLLSDRTAADSLASHEPGAVEHMNADHGDAVAAYARHFAKAEDGAWRLTGIDPDGLDLVLGDTTCRVDFTETLRDASGLRDVLVTMARQARGAA